MSERSEVPPPDSLAVVLEYVDPEALSIDPNTGEGSWLLRACAEVLAGCGVVTAETRLVITGDFVRSVRDRGEPGSAYHEAYDLQRNTGMVGGKTIPGPDSTIDVLLHAAMFLPDGNGEGPAAAELAIRTLLHEAQHVVIAQNGEAGHDFNSESWARRNFLVAADQVIEEYRAESVACRLAGPSGWSSDELIMTSEKWLEDLQRIAIREYQSHLDVGKLSYDILQQTHTVWKLLAYAVAEQIAANQPLPANVAEDRLWRLMVAPFWGEFTSLLGAAPAADQRTPRVDLDRLAQALAGLMQRWLLTLGFDFRDTPEGSVFLIADWSFLELD